MTDNFSTHAPEGTTRKLLALSWETMREHQNTAYAIVGIYIAFSFVSAILTASMPPPSATDKFVPPKDLTWICALVAHLYWMYSMLWGFSSKDHKHIARVCGRGFLYYLGLIGICFVIFIPLIALIFLLHAIGFTMAAILWIVMLTYGIGALYIFTRLFMVVPTAMSDRRVSWQECWRLADGWVFAIILATAVPIIPSVLLSSGYYFIDKVFSPEYVMSASAVLGIILALVSSFVTPFNVGIQVHAYKMIMGRTAGALEKK